MIVVYALLNSLLSVVEVTWWTHPAVINSSDANCYQLTPSLSRSIFVDLNTEVVFKFDVVNASKFFVLKFSAINSLSSLIGRAKYFSVTELKTFL